MRHNHREQSRTLAYRGRSHTPSTVVAGTIGNVMEWYDFALYGFFAPVFSQLFFPSESALTSLIATYGVFAAGFVMRPLGGVIFGYIGDRFGRAMVLRLSIAMMSLATFLLGILPGHAQVGVWSAVLLVAVRLLQGMSVGGEFSGSVTYMVETSPLHKRGLSGSWANFGSMAGTLLGSGLAALVTTVLAESQVDAWGWRLPFVLGGVFGLIAYGFVRKVATHPHMDHHEAQHENDSPLREALTRNRRETILAVVFASGYGILFYLPLVYLPTFATEVGGVNNALALQINAAGLAIAMPLIPLSGWISDHWLRRRSLLLLAFGLLVVTSVGVFLLAQGGAGSLALAQIGSAALLAVPLGAAPAMLVELFPVADRLTGYSLAYNVGLGVAGGSAPMIATWLISQTGQDLAPAYYMAFAALLSAAGLYLMKDRSREALR